MIVVNQDRNMRVEFNIHNDSLVTTPVISGGVLIGINLYLNDTLLGTFISVKEAIKEINNIYSNIRQEYCITVY